MESPQCIKVEDFSLINGHHAQPIKVSLRAVKAGKISESIKFKIFDALVLEVKVFAACRSSSIRSKKLGNLNSTRDFKNEGKFY